MITYRIEHPSNGYGPFVNHDHKRLKVDLAKPVHMTMLDDCFFALHTKSSGRGLPATPYDDIKNTEAKGTDAQRQSIKLFDAHMNACHRIDQKLIGHSKTLCDMVYGFYTREQLDLWFDADAKLLLKKYGFHETRYTVPDDCCAQLLTQAIWLRRDAVKLAEEVL